MAVTATWFGNAGKHIAAGEIAYLTDNIKCMLVNSAYTFNKDTHEKYSDVVGNEVAAGAGYTTGGLLLGTKTLVYDTGTDRTRYFCANSVWTPSAGQTLSANGAIIYKVGATNAVSWLMGYINFGQTISATGAGFTVNYDATDGVLYIQA